MTKHGHTWKQAPLVYLLPIIIGIVFIYLNYKAVGPTGGADSRSFLINLTIIIPEIVIWLIATAGAVRLKQYAVSIKDSDDGKSLVYIANALLLLTVYIVLLTISGTLTRLFVNSSFLLPAVALRNHFPIAVALVSVAYLYAGSLKLNKLIPYKIWAERYLKYFIGLSCLFFLIFAWSFYKAVPTLEPVNGIPRFALPVGVLIFTYVLPHIVLWLTGLLACINIAHYGSKTPGALYKPLFRDLYRGILLVYACIFMAQFLVISSVTISGFNAVLIMIYGLLILSTIGFVLIFRGARQLHKIEKIT